MVYLLFQERGVNFQRWTYMIYFICHDLKVMPGQMAYMSFLQGREGVNFQRWNVTLYIILIIYFTYRTLTFKNGEMAYLSFQ